VDNKLDEREQRLVANCCTYADGDPAGLPGHNLMIIIAKLKAQADELLHLAGKGTDHLQIEEMIAKYSQLVNGHDEFFGNPPAGKHVLDVALHKLKLMVAAYDVDLNFFLANASREALVTFIQNAESIHNERAKVLNAIPACPEHGSGCIPHAIEWIEGKASSC
jgi:hypothetical protein